MYILMDIGGTYIRIAPMEVQDKPLLEKQIHFKTANNYVEDIDNIVNAIDKLATNEIEKISVSIAGVLNENKSSLTNSPNLSDWNNKEFKKDLEEKYSCKVFLENDALCSAIGEAVYDLTYKEDFIYIAWGTGVGGAIIRYVDNKIVSHVSELGHQIVEINGLMCSCGQKGCLEAYTGGRQVVKNIGKQLDELTDVQWQEIINRMTQGVINLIIMNPVKKVIFSGGMANYYPHIVQRIKESIKDRLKIYPMPSIDISNLKGDAGIYGAAAILKFIV